LNCEENYFENNFIYDTLEENGNVNDAPDDIINLPLTIILLPSVIVISLMIVIRELLEKSKFRKKSI